MININMKASQEKNHQLDNSFLVEKIGVSRETCENMHFYYSLLFQWNQKINLVSRKSMDSSWPRHFLDSAQLWFSLPKGVKSWLDFGSGAGFPGLIIAILTKDRKIPLKIKLLEKSSKKAKFLENLIDELNLDVEVINQNVFEYSKKMSEDIFVARAFKPLQIILKLIHNNAEKWKKIFIFLGKTGKNELLQASKIWNIEYKQRMSVTSNDSLVIEINRLKKIN